MKKIIKCLYCGKKVEYYDTTSPNRKFCSLSCSTIYNNKLRTKKIKVSCKKCGKIFECCPSQKRIYCSRKCCTKWGSENVMWNGGVIWDIVNTAKLRKLRKEIRKRDNFICKECGKQGKNLHTHHIDYNKKNNNSSNLITLCINCHMKTNFKRKDWEEHFKCLLL